MTPGEMTPVIVVGQVETFAPAVIEARGVHQLSDVVQTARWKGQSLFSISPGGVIIESIQIGHTTPATAQFFYKVAVTPQKPFTGDYVIDSSEILSCGGQKLSSVLEAAVLGAPFPEPQANLLGGSQSRIWNAETIQNLWVPPGWYFWVITRNNSGASQSYGIGWKWRELLEPQGPR